MGTNTKGPPGGEGVRRESNRNILWSLITSVYKYNSQVLDSNMEEMENAESLIEQQRKSAQHDQTIMNEINGLNLTNKRKISIFGSKGYHSSV